MKTYKGFKKGLVDINEEACFDLDQPVTVDDDAAIESYRVPLMAWSLYPPVDDNEYTLCEAGGVIDQEGDIITSTEIVVKRRLSIEALVEEQLVQVRNRETATSDQEDHVVSTKNNRPVATVGDMACAATTGALSSAVTAGYSSHVVTTGIGARAVTAGNEAHAVTTGDNSHIATAGIRSFSKTCGKNSHAVATGNWSRTETVSGIAATVGAGARSVAAGKDAIAVGLGKGSLVKGVMGSWLVCGWWSSSQFLGTKSIQITEDSQVRPDRWYYIDQDGNWKEMKL